MMIKINGEYLDFNGDIEIERKIKAFENIVNTDGDLSFEFEIQDTARNRRILKFPYADVSSKRVYQKVDCEIINDVGSSVSIGYIRIERHVGNVFYCSYFGGNTVWMNEMTGNLGDINLSEFDVEQSESEIIASWSRDYGIVYPLIDSGILSTRMYANLVIEDFSPGFYVKNIFKKAFESSGMKVNGELLSDPFFNSLIVFANTKSNDEVNKRTSFVQKTTTQSGPVSDLKLTFEDDSNDPYFDGSIGNYDLPNSRYIPDVKMRLEIDLTMTGTFGGSIFDAYVNGVFSSTIGASITGASTFVGKTIINVEAGDHVEIYVTTLGDIEGGTVKFTPRYIYSAYGSSTVPQWTKFQFVSNIMSLFCAISKYDPYTKTVTINIFDKLKSKSPVDLSRYVGSPEVDYTDFISNYAKSNIFAYKEGERIEDKSEYNISELIQYGSGELVADNYFAEESETVLDSEFTSPISYKHRSIGSSIERINFIEYEEEEQSDIFSFVDVSGVAAVVVDDENKFPVGSLVKITNSTVREYNGDWLVIEIGNSPDPYFKALGLYFTENGTGNAASLRHVITDSEDVFIMSNVTLKNVRYFSPLNDIYLNFTPLNEMGIAYFNMLNLGFDINEDFKQGLSFGGVNNPLSYQRTLLDTFWIQFARILNDPVKLISSAHLPQVVYDRLDFMSPVYIKTLQSSNLYYLNRDTGYQGSSLPCEIELIKLS